MQELCRYIDAQRVKDTLVAGSLMVALATAATSCSGTHHSDRPKATFSTHQGKEIIHSRGRHGDEDIVITVGKHGVASMDYSQTDGLQDVQFDNIRCGEKNSRLRFSFAIPHSDGQEETGTDSVDVHAAAGGQQLCGKDGLVIDSGLDAVALTTLVVGHNNLG